MNADAEPMNASSHIQKMAPGPPSAIAVATPAKFPVPTREAVAIQNAWNDDTVFFPLPLETPSPNRRNISLKLRNCTKRLL